MTPAGQTQTYWHENSHFALFSHHMCYFQIVECNFKIIHLFWLPVEWSFAHRWLKNWVASPVLTPKNTFFFFLKAEGGKSATFVPSSPLPPFCWSPLVDSGIQTLLVQKAKFLPRRSDPCFSRCRLSIAREAACCARALRARRLRGQAAERRHHDQTITAEASAPRLKPTGMDLGPRSGTS